jgi:hypothetical protein
MTSRKRCRKYVPESVASPPGSACSKPASNDRVRSGRSPALPRSKALRAKFSGSVGSRKALPAATT